MKCDFCRKETQELKRSEFESKFFCQDCRSLTVSSIGNPKPEQIVPLEPVAGPIYMMDHIQRLRDLIHKTCGFTPR